MGLEFTRARPDTVRAAKQRQLLEFWARYLDGARVPRWHEVSTDELDGMSDDLSLLDVTNDRPPRFLIRFLGSMIAEAYGSTACRGCYLDEIVSPTRRYGALAPYAHAVRSGAPVYVVHDITDRAGQPVQFERLLLPFARDGETVDRILASFEFVSPDGDFNAHALISAATAPSGLRLSATIEVPAMA
jgi:hypothetical protein